MDRILRGERISLEILPPLPVYVEALRTVVQRNRDHLDEWRGDVIKYEESEAAFYKLLMDNYYYERGDGYFYHIMKKGEIIGHIGLVFSGKVWEISYWLDKDYTSQGYMCEALKTLERAWFQHSTDALTIYVNAKNESSLNVVKKMNYIPFGINRYLKNFTIFMNEDKINIHSTCIVPAQKKIELDETQLHR